MPQPAATIHWLCVENGCLQRFTVSTKHRADTGLWLHERRMRQDLFNGTDDGA